VENKETGEERLSKYIGTTAKMRVDKKGQIAKLRA
jgi:hypothetical protein